MFTGGKCRTHGGGEIAAFGGTGEPPPGGGGKRGQGNHMVPLPPFAPAAGRRLSRAAEGGNFPPAVGTALPAGEHRLSRPPKAANSPLPWVRQ